MCDRIRNSGLLYALVLFLGAMVAIEWGGTGNVWAGATGVVEDKGDEVKNVYLSVGRATILKAPWAIKRVSVAEPSIADVQVIAPNQLVVVTRAKAVGSTDLHLWNEAGELWHAVLHVEQDLTLLKGQLKKFFPESTLDLTHSNGVLVVSGKLRRAEDSRSLQNFLKTSGVKAVDMTSVAGVQQVQLRVRIAEASRDAIRSMGANAVHGSDDFFGGSVVGGNPNNINIGVDSGSSATSLDFGFNSATSVASTVTLFGGFPRADLEVFVDALIENRYVRLLAEPTLVALSGEEASFLAGGEFPVPVAQSGTGDSATITVEFKEFGIGLKFRPTVLGDGSIRMYVEPEVSDVSFVNGITSGGVTVPSIITRRAQTTLQMKSGQTFAMAGLLDRSVNTSRSGVPGLVEVPILGNLFRSVRYEKGETDLIVLVTASLVEPLSNTAGRPIPGDAHQSPSDWEFYANGRIEGKLAPKISTAHERWLKRRGLDRLTGPGAWADYEQVLAPLRGLRKMEAVGGEK